MYNSHMLESDSNCIGYALCRLGIIEEEGLMWPPSFSQAMEWFDEVPELSEADAVGVLSTRLSVEDPKVIHLAVLDKEDPTQIFHRRGKCMPVTQGTLEEDLGMFLAYPDKYRIVYLKVKSKPGVVSPSLYWGHF